MSGPARKWEKTENISGHSDSSPPISSSLRELEDSGEEPSRKKEHLWVVPDEEGLRQQENSPGKKNPEDLSEVDRQKSFYKVSRYGGRGLLAWKRNHKLLLGVGAFVAGVVAIAILFFGFLSVFKLDHIMSNIGARTFARLHGVQEKRSHAWMNAYLKVRLLDEGRNPKMDPGKEQNVFFRASRVNRGFTPNHLVLDWYRTMRTSKFEQDLLEKQGIKFTSVLTADGRVRTGRVDIKGEKPILIEVSGADIKGIEAGEIKAFNKYSQYLDTKVFSTDKEARRAIRKAVRENTHWSQVFTRRHTRKAIQNMTGVRDWRFFENTRNKVDEKKIDIRNKIIAKAVPESTKSGKFVHCLFGISDCKFSRDPVAPENRAEGALRGDADVKNGKPLKNRDENDNSKDHPNPDVVDLSQGADAVKKITSSILSKVNPALSAINLIATLDILTDIHKAFEGGKISKGVAVARGVQAMGLYQVFTTARDQMRTGEVQGAEVNAFMKELGPVANNEAYVTVIDGSSRSFTLSGNKVLAKSTVTREQYCSPEYQAKLEKDRRLAEKEFAFVCPSKQIGGGTRAKSLEDTYNKSIGNFLGPFLGTYNGVRDMPIVGKVLDGFLGLWNRVAEAIIGTAVNTILSTLGLADDAAKAVQWMMTKVMAFLGAGPILTGQEAAGETMNWLIQGGAYAAEVTSRTNGASLTTTESAALAKKTVAWHAAEEEASRSLTDRYLSLSNHESLMAGTAFSASQLNLAGISAAISDFALLFKSFIEIIISPLTPQTKASSNSPYAAAELAGIATYDFPSKCYDMDPLSSTPGEGTNINQIVSGISESELTWDLVTDSTAWYDYLYKTIGDEDNPDEIAEKVYNCHLLDTSIRGSLGYLYGYTEDNGLEESTPSGEDQTDSEVPGTSAPSVEIDLSKIGEHSESVACVQGSNDLGVVESRYRGSFKSTSGVLKIRLCQLNNLPGNGNNSAGQLTTAGAVVNSRVSAAWAALAEKAKADGVSLFATSSFRLADSCGGSGDGGLCATPGTSPHQLGVALDLNIGGSGKGSSISCSGRETADTPGWKWMHQNASRFGIYQYSKEAWHWDPLKSLSNRCP